MVTSRLELDERFTGGTLDTDVWFPYYLPHWSSRAGSAATFSLHGGELHLSIPDQPLWCADVHEEPLRVSCIQSGSFAGPLGATTGQQPFREGLQVREEQPTMWGYTPLYGQVEARMRGVITARSMFAFWMSGIEDRPERSGEICVAEVFGDAVRDGCADVGMGVHRFHDDLADARTASGQLLVTEHLRLPGHDTVFAIGDITAIDEPKMAARAGRHAEVAAANIRALISGHGELTAYQPLPPVILVPLGPHGGAAQLPGTDGIAGPDIAAQYKGRDLFTDRYAETFGLLTPNAA